jgi:hypothetical protein
MSCWLAFLVQPIEGLGVPIVTGVPERWCGSKKFDPITRTEKR